MYTEDELHKLVRDQRMARFVLSDQFSLGRLIDELEKIDTHGHYPPRVMFDFEDLFPTNFNSWRGAYDELCLNFSTYGKNEPHSLPDFIKMCKHTIGETFIGYKGGEYRMTEQTPVWVANYGKSGNTALVGLLYAGINVVLLTAYREF